MLSQCNQSAGTLLQMVVSEFPSYRDEADYMGKRGRIEENFMFIPVRKYLIIGLHIWGSVLTKKFILEYKQCSY